MFLKRFLTALLVFNLIFGGVAYSEQPAGFTPPPAPSQAPAGAGAAEPSPPLIWSKKSHPSLRSQNGAEPAETSPQLTPPQAEMLQKATPEQQKAVQEVLSEKGGVITPEATETLKTKPEFQGLTPEDILKGQEILEKKEAEEKEIKKKEPLGVMEKRVIGEEPEKESLFTRYRQIGKYQDIPTALEPFGYEFFRQAAIKVLTDRKDIPAPAEYVVGPGDEVKILLWGRVNAQYSPIVDRDGNITIPQIGPLQVAGMTFEQMSEYLIKQAEQIVGANISVTMGALKSIPIFVLGDVRRPGAYTIGSFATITDALLLTGGPSGIGTMRNVQLRRKDKVITTLDLYDLLLKGDKSKDRMLQAGDIVFVPVAGSLVGVAGHVKRPAIYELRAKKDLMSLIDLAGGIIPTAYTQQIQVERIVKSERQIVVDINDKDLTRAKDFMLQDGDLIKVFPIVEKDTNAIYINGNVKHPGKYEHKPGMRIKDIIKDATELLPETYFGYALIKRMEPPDLRAGLIPFRLDRLLLDNDEGSNIELKPQDDIYIFSKWFFKDKPFVVVEGQVRSPGRFELSENKRLRDAILLAGDLTKDAYLKKGEIIRVDDKREYKTIYFQVEKALAGDPGENLLLKDEDRIIIHSMWEEKWKETVSISGEVKKPGEFVLTEGLAISDLIFKAGGLTRDAYSDVAELYRTDWRTKEVTLERFNLQEALAGAPEHNLKLKDLDRVVVHSILEKIYKEAVSIEGEVLKPGTYQYAKNITVRDLIFKAGRLTRDAYLDEAELYRTDWRTKEVTLQRFNLKEALSGATEHNLKLKDLDRVVVHSIWEKVYKKTVSIEGEVLKPGAYQYAENMTVRDLIFTGGQVLESAYLGEAEISSQIIEDGKTVKIEHKEINLRKAMAGDPAHNLVLKPYDTLLVKRLLDWRKERFVNISGEIRFPGRYLVKKDERLSSLIERAGGYTGWAYFRGAEFTRVRVKELQQKSLEEMVNRLERELLAEGSIQVSTALSQEEIEAKKAELESKRKFLESLRKLEAKGRMAIRLSHLRLLKGSEYDFSLEEGDSLYIPASNKVVNVVGAVMAPGSFIYLDRQDHKDYIEMAGGYSRYADEDNAYVLKVDGTARRLSSGFISWNPFKSRQEVTALGEEVRPIEAGDSIVVPEKLERIAWLREIKDITQILMQMAVTAGVVIHLF